LNFARRLSECQCIDDNRNVRTLVLNRLTIAAVAAAAACSGACAASGYSPKPFPMPGRPSAAPPAPTHPAPEAVEAPSRAAPDGSSHHAPLGAPVDSYALVGAALSLRGTPYKNGGSDPQGFDCSGFTQYVFSQFGLPLPREVREQYRVGKAVKAEDLAPGDILFFTTTAPGPSHVAIAIGGDQFVHAPSSTGVVRVERLGSSYWSPRYLGARRVVN
jgi:cell wall-associated NlpC family hydrolase